LDEAFSALDPGTRKDMQRLIRQLWRDTGITVLFVTHNTQEALYLSSRVIVLAKEAPDQGSRSPWSYPSPSFARSPDFHHGYAARRCSGCTANPMMPLSQCVSA